jgi:acetaldehyde dehydrogenase (acetylating)
MYRRLGDLMIHRILRIERGECISVCAIERIDPSPNQLARVDRLCRQSASEGLDDLLFGALHVVQRDV